MISLLRCLMATILLLETGASNFRVGKQRISIARTLLKNPKIVIFDEATSALDSNSETLIQKDVEPLLKSRPSLVIAHRLSTIISADVIYVVKDGRMFQRGTHAELLQAGGFYKELYDKQL